MKVFPVVHIKNPEVAVHQTAVALEHGADGVYLIDHHTDSAAQTLETLKRAHEHYPDAYIGVNLLGLSAIRAVREIERFVDGGEQAPSGLWIDDIRMNNGLALGRPMEIKNAHVGLRDMRILGGVAFKYTSTFTENPEEAAQEVGALIDATDVITTSGAVTGTPPTYAKIAAMKRAAGSKPLAVASGISLNNIENYIRDDGTPLIDEILVASSVETKPGSGIFDLATLKAFIDKAGNNS